MKLINYEKYQKKWTPRDTLLYLVTAAVASGLFLGTALGQAIGHQDVWKWGFSLVLAFSNGVGTLVETLVALHNCSTTKATGLQG